MQEITELAEKLGQAIKENDRFKKVKELEENLKNDDDAKKLIEEHEAKARAIQKKESELVPVDVEEKKELMAMEEKIRANETLMNLMKAQADYAELINKVNENIFKILQ